MKPTRKANHVRAHSTALLLLLAAGTAYGADATTIPDKQPFKQEELDQMLAPIALYPDSLLSQMLMASTYPLEVVQADRWAKQNKTLKGDALTQALEAQSWDPSVKSLVNFPDVLAMMSEKLDVTIKIGDAFIEQQTQVMETIQKLRLKAQETGNLKSTPEQKVVVQQQPQSQTQVIVIEPTNPQVVYVPTYSPTVVYGAWPYPAYPPAPYYPPGYVASNALSFTAGVAVGAAWGYAWGHCNWNSGNVDVNVNRNTSINSNINRSNYQNQMQSRNSTFKNGSGTFQHDASHRQGVAYRDKRTTNQYGRASQANAQQAREAYRGRTATGAQNLPAGSGAANRPNPGAPGAGGANRTYSGASQRPTPAGGQSAFDGVNRGGSAARTDSARGSASRSAPTRSAPARSGGGGGARGGGGGGGRGGGRR